MIGILNCIRNYNMNKADKIKNILRRQPADWAFETLAFILDLEQTVKTHRERKDELTSRIIAANNRNLALAQENDALRKTLHHNVASTADLVAEKECEEQARHLVLEQENDVLRKERLTAAKRVLELEEELARHQHCHSLSENTLRRHIQVLQQQRARLENTCEHQAREVNELRRNSVKPKETPEAREVRSLRDEVTRYHTRCAELEHRLRKVRLAAEPSAEPKPIAEVGHLFDGATRQDTHNSADPAAMVNEDVYQELLREFGVNNGSPKSI